MEKTLKIKGMTCEHCVKNVKNALLSVQGVSEAQVELETRRAVVTLEGEVLNDALSSAVEEAGYKVLSIA